MTAPASALYSGRVTHRRLKPRVHRLAYRVFWMLLDLDEIEQHPAARLRLFSRNRFNLYSFHDTDYGDGSGRPLREQIEQALRASGQEPDGGPIRLLTMPRILGYAFNPLNTYFCYRRDGDLRAIVYEVHNTFGEVHSYVAPAEGGVTPVLQEAGKSFHVSPFMSLDMRYRFHVVPPGETVAVSIDGLDAGGRIISATLGGRREALSDRALLRLFATHPLLTLKVTAAIHWHALRLVLKRVPIWTHPPAPTRNLTVGALRTDPDAPRQ